MNISGLLRQPATVLLCLFLIGCVAPSPGPEPTRPPAPTASPTATLAPTRTAKAARRPPTRTPAPRPSSTSTSTLQPTPAATLDTLRLTPPTLMLHPSSLQFDSVAFLKEFVKLLQDKDFRVVTYQDISRDPDITATQAGQLFILTVDDISLQAELQPSVQEMIAVLREAGYPAVLGIVTTGTVPNEKTARALKDLAGQGWELAMHTDTHANLNELEQVSIYGARLEIRTCADKIFQSTGVRPVTLVLPYGAMVTDLKILSREHVVWTVGINGGEKYRTTNITYYVGREGPDGSPQLTFDIMMRRFGRSLH